MTKGAAASGTAEATDAGDVLVIGAGLAGLFTALKLAPMRVTVLCRRAPGVAASSAWAQGGIAAALGADDSPALHAEDTIAAGAGLVDPEIARLLAEDAAARIDDLVQLGVPFDHGPDGKPALGQEAAHSRARIVHVSGDRAGAAIMTCLAEAATAAPSIHIRSGCSAVELALAGGRVHGVWVMCGGRLQLFRAPHVVLATGGIGGLYEITTNPVAMRGDGLAMAARAGGQVADPEFVQFHPTAMQLGQDPAPLATEALRGEGAVLITADGERFMSAFHPDAELAPRDVVARAIHMKLMGGARVFLDCRKAIGRAFPERFPTVYAACRKGGIDPAEEPIPVAPAAHYHMGGVRTDTYGQTSVPGLLACGEVAATGAHGANRLASNSLLEGLVFGARIAEALQGHAANTPHRNRLPPPGPRSALPPRSMRRLRRLMTAHAGLVRHEDGLRTAACDILALERSAGAANALNCAKLIVAAAANRRESRGSHFRSDHPYTLEEARHSVLTMDAAEAAIRELANARAPRQQAAAP